MISKLDFQSSSGTLSEIMDIFPWRETTQTLDTTEEMYFDRFKLKKILIYDQASVYKAFLNPLDKGTF